MTWKPISIEVAQHFTERLKQLCSDKLKQGCITALLLKAEAHTNNRPLQTVDPDKLTRKFYKNNFWALLGGKQCTQLFQYCSSITNCCYLYYCMGILRKLIISRDVSLTNETQNVYKHFGKVLVAVYNKIFWTICSRLEVRKYWEMGTAGDIGNLPGAAKRRYQIL